MLIFDTRKIGNNLLNVRKKAGLTQAEVAEAAGLSDRTYADIERGGVNMKIETVEDKYQAVRLDGYTNTWSAFEKLITDDDTYYIFENDVWGDETCYVVTHQENLEPICETYDDIVTALKDEEII